MGSGRRAAQLAALVAALALGGCVTAGPDSVETTATVAAAPPPAARAPDAPKDDLALAKEHFRARNYGLSEMHFRRAVERARGDAEAWLGLAASYDQLKRFRLADRAYGEALKLIGPTPEFLNNRGYSYLLRGDLAKASRDLSEAQAQAPDDERIRNNLAALEARARGRS
jgi:Flp pilus assembly protein TadD